MVLNETGKSQWGWKQNSMISIDKASGKVVYNPEFFLMKHLSYFVTPGSKYIKVSGDGNCLAFLSDNHVVILYYNADDADQAKTFILRGQAFTVSLKARSFNTFMVKI